MSKHLTRRDFLKLFGLMSASIVAKPLSDLMPDIAQDSPSIIILVLDAWSARNASLYGYPRQTMPNLDQFAETSTVYHRHYSTAPFTTPGTASLLTGLYPWTHRAINLGGSITARHEKDQIFTALSKTHNSVGYSQNVYADLFLYQAGQYLQTHLSNSSFNKQHNVLYNLPIFEKDAFAAFSSIEDNIIQRGLGQDGSLFLGPLYRFLNLRDKSIKESEAKYEYPSGLPAQMESFALADLMTGTVNILNDIKSPSLIYLHFFPPHDPYRPLQRFNRHFRDGWSPPEKPIHPLAQSNFPYSEILYARLRYDQYLASLDDELSKLFDFFKTSTLVKNSFVFITSDHGEMFERGEKGHMTPLLYEALMNIPLIVKQPGQNQRMDILTPTSSVDILPTLAHLTGNPIPSWAQGDILPGLGGKENPKRSIYVMNAKTNGANVPLKELSISLTKENYRLTLYQYSGNRDFELYDLEQDPEEVNNLHPLSTSIAKSLEKELLQKMDEISQYPEQQ